MIPKIVTDNAACKGRDTDREFYRDADSSKKDKDGVPLHPGHICFRCPVIDECLEHALHNEAYGTWGGMTERELYRARKRLGIPQPASGIGLIVFNGSPV